MEWAHETKWSELPSSHDSFPVLRSTRAIGPLTSDLPAISLPTNDLHGLRMYGIGFMPHGSDHLTSAVCRDSSPAAVQCMLPVPGTSSAR